MITKIILAGGNVIFIREDPIFSPSNKLARKIASFMITPVQDQEFEGKRSGNNGVVTENRKLTMVEQTKVDVFGMIKDHSPLSKKKISPEALKGKRPRQGSKLVTEYHNRLFNLSKVLGLINGGQKIYLDKEKLKEYRDETYELLNKYPSFMEARVLQLLLKFEIVKNMTSEAASRRQADPYLAFLNTKQEKYSELLDELSGIIMQDGLSIFNLIIYTSINNLAVKNYFMALNRGVVNFDLYQMDKYKNQTAAERKLMLEIEHFRFPMELVREFIDKDVWEKKDELLMKVFTRKELRWTGKRMEKKDPLAKKGGITAFNILKLHYLSVAFLKKQPRFQVFARERLDQSLFPKSTDLFIKVQNKMLQTTELELEFWLKTREKEVGKNFDLPGQGRTIIKLCLDILNYYFNNAPRIKFLKPLELHSPLVPRAVRIFAELYEKNPDDPLTLKLLSDFYPYIDAALKFNLSKKTKAKIEEFLVTAKIKRVEKSEDLFEIADQM